MKTKLLVVIFKIVGNDLYLLVPKAEKVVSGEIDINQSCLLIDAINKILKGYEIGIALEFEMGEPIQMGFLGSKEGAWYFPILICALWIDGICIDKFIWVSLENFLKDVCDFPNALKSTAAGIVACEAAMLGLTVSLDHLD